MTKNKRELSFECGLRRTVLLISIFPAFHFIPIRISFKQTYFDFFRDCFFTLFLTNFAQYRSRSLALIWFAIPQNSFQTDTTTNQFYVAKNMNRNENEFRAVAERNSSVNVYVCVLNFAALLFSWFN